MGSTGVLRGTRRSKRGAERPTVRRLRAEISITTRGDECTIVGGPQAGMDAAREGLASIGVRVPRGRSRLVVTVSARGRWRVHDTLFKRVTLGASVAPMVDGVNFCWLPREFRRQWVTVACLAPSKRRASASGSSGARPSRRQRP